MSLWYEGGYYRGIVFNIYFRHLILQLRHSQRVRVVLCLGRLDPPQRRHPTQVDVQTFDDVPRGFAAGHLRRRNRRRLWTSRRYSVSGVLSPGSSCDGPLNPLLKSWPKNLSVRILLFFHSNLLFVLTAFSRQLTNNNI